ncbi:sensor histidine kinase [Chryseolinea lacunae]|uniref:histidine kinase n=1 Tax=Chryseolinea lacunae TaxID=2801331 RepID=A0ABS1KXS7_9BACT|nr:HAMP domain-containing sensor histidine kinase [Chryseolinea lacunae]MBL0744184.1 HAMP domain-containing histidine kinase [Chryseolinea lacunae]
MLIRYKIIIWFSGLTGVLFFLFSLYIYVAYTNSREEAFRERIRNKALATKEIYDLHNQLAEKIITSIPEQSEYVFDEHRNLVFAINDLNDFKFDQHFLDSVKKNKEFYFEYLRPRRNEQKDGYAFSFGPSDQTKIIIITAYDKIGREQARNLAYILIFGNIFFLMLIGLSGYLFARSILKPIDELVTQAEAVRSDDVRFRLHYRNPRDEIGVVAASFNKVLERIQELVELQKSFIAHASHELRTPLTAVSGILETSVNYDNDVHTVKKSMKAGHKELQKAIGLINGLLQLAKVDATEEIEMQRINSLDLLIDVISFFKLKNLEQEFLLRIDECLPKDVSIELMGNIHLLRTALLNIIDNASKYSSGKKIEIFVRAISESSVSISFTDQGIGIQDEDMKNILDPLYRGKNTMGIEGFGLGLPLTKRIVALHKGEMIVKNNTQGGVTVTLLLPANVIQAV